MAVDPLSHVSSSYSLNLADYDTTPTTSLETDYTPISRSSTPLSSLPTEADDSPGLKTQECNGFKSYYTDTPYSECCSSDTLRFRYYPFSLLPDDSIELKLQYQSQRTILLLPPGIHTTSAIYTVVLQKSNLGRRPHVKVFDHFATDRMTRNGHLVGVAHIHHRVRDRVDWQVYGKSLELKIDTVNLRWSDASLVIGLRASLPTPKKKSVALLDAEMVLGLCSEKDVKDEPTIQIPVLGEQSQPDEILRIPMSVIQDQKDMAIIVTVIMALALRNLMILRRGAKPYKTDPIAAICPKMGAVGAGATTMILAANLGGGIGC